MAELRPKVLRGHAMERLRGQRGDRERMNLATSRYRRIPRQSGEKMRSPLGETPDFRIAALTPISRALS
jgi:hypothetical protein